MKKDAKWWAWITLCATTHAVLTERFGGNFLPGSWLEFFVDVIFAANIVFCINKIGEK